VGRFSVESGINFNREYPDVVAGVTKRIDGQLTSDADRNVKLIRSAMQEVIAGTRAIQEEVAMKKALYGMAVEADIVLDLHCDSHAVMHMYTHDRLWPVVSDLAAELGSECHLLAPAAGGDPFDEACSCPWAALADRFPAFPIPMACQAVTVELRGESDVYDEYATKDAQAIFRFLQRRGLISMDASATAVTTGTAAASETGTGDTCDNATVPTSSLPLPPLIRNASPLSGVDMIEAEKTGVVAWRVKPGQVVSDGQVLGEIVDCEDPDAPRVEVKARTAGVVFSMSRHKLVRPGNVIVKVAGVEPLPWRTGNLLTSR
jgi:predicted deacylase